MHKNGVRPSGVFSVEGTLSAPQQKQLTDWIKEQAAAENVGNPLIIDRGAKLVGNIMSASTSSCSKRAVTRSKRSAASCA
jgi:phage portal protein BeeE